ncbi:MAG: hypothetical protein QF652_04780 [Dehalococcoidia bacterium]|nr:hypothetical protein [Dehalococcoidia bacterium]
MVASEPMSGAETFFGTFGAVVTFAAATSYLNHRYLHLPSTIALMAAALLGSLGIVALGTAGVVDQESVRGWVESLDFGTVSVSQSGTGGSVTIPWMWRCEIPVS